MGSFKQGFVVSACLPTFILWKGKMKKHNVLIYFKTTPYY